MPDINVNALAEIVNEKVDLDCKNVATGEGADAVVAFQMPTTENNYAQYRKYASGWIEQGGRMTKPDSSAITIILPVTMADNHYHVLLTDNYSNDMATSPSYGDKTTTDFKVYQNNGSSLIVYYRVCGIAASQRC